MPRLRFTRTWATLVFSGHYLIPAIACAVPILTDVPDKVLGNIYETETAVATSPSDPKLAVVSNIRVGQGVSAWVTTDGGVTWFDYTSAGALSGGDPSCIVRDLSTREIVVTAQSPVSGPVVEAYSIPQGGGSWSANVAVDPFPFDPDRANVAVDNFSSGNHFGDMYAACHEIPDANVGIDVNRYLHLQGAWQVTERLQGTDIRAQSDLEVGKSGVAYLAWTTLIASGGGFQFRETAFSLSKFDPYAPTPVWSAPVTIVDNIAGLGAGSTAVSGTITTKSNSAPWISIDRRGTGPDKLFVVWPNRGLLGVAYEPESAAPIGLYMTRSFDGGATWDTPVQVADTFADTDAQWHVNATFDEASGALVVAYLSGNGAAGSTSTYLAVSYDAVNVGETPSWQTMRVGDAFWSGDGPSNSYDYIGVSASGGIAYPAWSDPRSGDFRAYVSPTLIGGIDTGSITPIVSQSCAGINDPRVRLEVHWSTLVAMDGTDKLTVTPPAGSPQVATAASTGTYHELILYDLPCANGTWTYTVESNKGGATSKVDLTQTIACMSCPPPCRPPCELE